MTARFPLPATVLIAALALAGCAQDVPSDVAPSATAAPTAAAAAPGASTGGGTGTDTDAAPGTADGTGYTFTVPDGYEASATTAAGLDLSYNTTPSQGVPAFLFTAAVPAAGDTVDVAAAGLMGQLVGNGYTGVATVDPVTVAAGAFAHVVGDDGSAGIVVQTDLFLTVHDGSVHQLTLGFPQGTDQATRDGVATTVLESWTWQ